MSWINELFDTTVMKQLQQINHQLIERFHSVDIQEKVVLYLDSTNAATYGCQQESAYNTHYGEHGYHPTLMFDGLTGDCLTAELWVGSIFHIEASGPLF